MTNLHRDIVNLIAGELRELTRWNEGQLIKIMQRLLWKNSREEECRHS